MPSLRMLLLEPCNAPLTASAGLGRAAVGYVHRIAHHAFVVAHTAIPQW